MNLDFETGDSYNWNSLISNPLWSNSIVSPGHSRSGVTSKFAAQISREIGVTQTYAFSRYDQLIPNMVPGTTYRYEFSFKYDNDVKTENDNCEFTVGLWGVEIAKVSSTHSINLPSFRYANEFLVTGHSFYYFNETAELERVIDSPEVWWQQQLPKEFITTATGWRVAEIHWLLQVPNLRGRFPKNDLDWASVFSWCAERQADHLV